MLECARVVNSILLMLVFMYVSETVLWKEKERSRVRAVEVEMDNLRRLLGIKRIYRVSNAQINKAYSGSSAMWREWRGIGLPRESMQEMMIP